MASRFRRAEVALGFVLWFGASLLSDRLCAQSSPPGKTPADLQFDRYGDVLPPAAMVRLGTVKYRQDSPIYRISYASNGRHLVTDGADGVLRVWDVASGCVIRRLAPHVGAMEDFALSPDGAMVLATGVTANADNGRNRQVRLIEITSGLIRQHASWPVTEFAIMPLALSAARGLHAVCSDDGLVRVRDVWTGKEACRFAVRGHRAGRMQFSGDGRRLAVMFLGHGAKSLSHQVVIYDLSKHEISKTIKLGESLPDDMAFSTDGNRIAIALSSQLVVFSARALSDESVRFDNVSVHRIAFSDDGQRIAAVGGAGWAGLFDVPTCHHIAAMRVDLDRDARVAASPDGHSLVASDGEGVLHTWDVNRRDDRFAMPEAHSYPVNHLRIASGGRTAITSSEDGTIRLWDLKDGRQTRLLIKQLEVSSMALSSDGRLLAVQNEDRQLFLWDLQRAGQPIVVGALPDGFEVRPLALTFVDRDQTILCFTCEGRLYAWDVKLARAMDVAQIRFRLEKNVKQFNEKAVFENAAFSADGKRLATAFDVVTGGGLRVIEIATRNTLCHLSGENVLAFSSDGRMVVGTTPGKSFRISRPSRVGLSIPKTGIQYDATGCTIHVQDVEAGKSVFDVDVKGSPVWAMAISPDGRTLTATSGWEKGEIHFFDMASGKVTRAINCPPLRSPVMGFTPDGSRLVCGMADSSVLVWDTGRATGKGDGARERSNREGEPKRGQEPKRGHNE